MLTRGRPPSPPQYKPGKIEASMGDMTLVVHYVKETITYDEAGNEVGKEEEAGTQAVKVDKHLAPGVDLERLAGKVVEKNKLIHPSKEPLVVQLLVQILEHKQGGGGNAMMPRGAAAVSRMGRVNREEALQQIQVEAAEAARLEDLDQYVEELYEEKLEMRVRATAMISHLFRTPEHLPELLDHPALVGALARVLRDDWMKSIDLEIYIVSSFFAVSLWNNLHDRLVEHLVGKITIDVIDLELKRAADREHDDGVAPSAVAQKVAEMQMGVSNPNISSRERRLIGVIQKQDRLLYYAFYLLLNLAEDVAIERKMRKHNIVGYLVQCLDRANVDLLLVAVMFLKKLSIFQENKDAMTKAQIVPKLVKFATVKNSELIMVVLRLLHNLSFDPTLRGEMVAHGVIQVGVELMKEPELQPVVMGLLYHLSMDDKAKSLFTYTGAITMVRDFLLQVDNLRETPELIALAVNLTQNKRNAELLCENQGLEKMINKALSTHDDLLFKVIRNISQSSVQIKRKFLPFLQDLLGLLKADVTSNVLVEVLGVLGNMTIAEVDFETLVQEHGLIDFLAAAIRPDVVEDDILLEVVVFLGTLCTARTAPLIVATPLIEALLELIMERKHDDEFVLQITFTFQKLMLFEETRNVLVDQTDAMSYLVDLLFDANKEVRRTASKAVDTVMDFNEDWAIRVRELKFRRYNAQWLETLQGGSRAPAERHVASSGEMDEMEMSGVDGGLRLYDGSEQVYADINELYGGADVDNGGVEY